MTPEEQKAFVDTIYAGYTEAELRAVDVQTFELEVLAVAKAITKGVEAMAQHFDPEVLVAALEIVLNDFATLLGDDES